MSTQFSPVIAAHAQGANGSISVQSLDLDTLGEWASPVILLHDFRLRGRPFAPHPHAGFSAVTYVFEDSPANLRSRDSLGNDVVTGPGGIVWTQAGSGAIHEELPAEPDRELHGLQVFVNLRAMNKLAAPQVFRLPASEVPEWRNGAGDRVRVLVGSLEGIASPLVPIEPFTLLEVELQRTMALTFAPAHNALLYVLAGDVLVRADGREQLVAGGHAMAMHSSGGHITIGGVHAAQLFVLSGAEIREPVLAEGPFIMHDRRQIEAAAARYRAGAMGYLAPLPER